MKYLLLIVTALSVGGLSGNVDNLDGTLPIAAQIVAIVGVLTAIAIQKFATDADKDGKPDNPVLAAILWVCMALAAAGGLTVAQGCGGVTTDPDAVVTADLPTDFAFTEAETGVAKLTASGLELWSGDGTAVTSESHKSLSFTGFSTPDSDTKRLVVVARHAWADDGSLTANDANRANFSLRLALNNLGRLFCAASTGVTAAGAFMSSAGALLVPSTASQPRTDVWSLISLVRASGSAPYWYHRLDNNRILASANPAVLAEANNLTWKAGNANAASTAIVKIYVRSVVVLSQ